MGTKLGEATEQRLVRIFSGSDLDQARALLVNDCAENLPFCESYSSEDLDRIRIAALKLCGGKLEALVDAITLAQTDWRDLLMDAGFGDPERHRTWWPE
jgi:hypothetical protein